MNTEPKDRPTAVVNDGAQAFIELINANSVDYIFLSPGSELVPIQEAIASFRAVGKRTPELVLGLHESISLAAAHGYFMVSGRPQVVLLHADLGTLQVGGALHNAQRGRAGIIIGAGRSAPIYDQPKPYGRRAWVEWMTEQYDQAGIVRNYVKWHYEMRSNENIHQVVQRAFQMATAEPSGPVYLVLSPELLMQKMEQLNIPDVTKYGAPATPEADSHLLDQAATALIEAENPLIIAGYSGRNHQAVNSLVELAETLGARVVSFQSRLSFPSTHPLWGGYNAQPYVNDADVILVIDHDVPYNPAYARLRPETKTIYIDIDPVKRDIPTWHFPADIPIQADSSKTIPRLTQMIQDKLSPQQTAIYQQRFRTLQQEHRIMREKWQQVAAAKASQPVISGERLCQEIAREITPQDILICDAVSNNVSAGQYIDRTQPGTLFDQAGSSIGWGLGAAVGAKLAAPEKTVVLLMGDGSFIYGCPTAALWASIAYNAPFLCIIFRNESYLTMKKVLKSRYGKTSPAQQQGIYLGTDIQPPPDYSLIAQACGGLGLKVEKPDELESALQDAFHQVRCGRTVVLDVKIVEG